MLCFWCHCSGSVSQFRNLAFCVRVIIYNITGVNLFFNSMFILYQLQSVTLSYGNLLISSLAICPNAVHDVIAERISGTVVRTQLVNTHYYQKITTITLIIIQFIRNIFRPKWTSSFISLIQIES